MRVRSLQIHRLAKADWLEIKAEDPDAAATIAAFLEQAKASPGLLDDFTSHGRGEDEPFFYDVSRWEAQQRSGRNLWRVKLTNTDDLSFVYRIIYAFDPENLTHYILGIFPRNEFDYDDEHEYTKRVVDIYDTLGIRGY